MGRNLQIEADRQAHLSIFDPSDRFWIAQAGVRVFSLAAGMRVRGKLKDLAPRAMQEFND